ncbi:MAG: phenylalanine--tRNA ligase subunit beta, partial [Crocinitomicaceae bacterium]|nr:phenylalanine--tRNA ligase subunit beta [Crocinitomicaceae bacterium]
MKISYNWLRTYIQTELSPEEISEILTQTGLEVEGIQKIEAVKGGLEGVLVGEVLTCEKHPDADKLKVTTIDIGAEILQIVCGASNVAVGQKVPIATVGCTLYPKPEEAFKIKLSKIRGIESQGMICAEDELGIGTSHEGILVLDPSTKNGTKAAEYFQLENDYQLEIGLTPNRADAMGHVGVARDLKAYLNFHQNKNLTLTLPDISKIESQNNNLVIDVSVENTQSCPLYCGISIKGIVVKPSPAWLQNRLRAVGQSPINNVVDVTNFVMRELGTPLHAFDAEKLNGRIVVKNATSGSKFITLDGVERTLDESNLMITNGEDDLCIAGVYGGINSGVKDSTTAIFLEAAYFEPVSIRKTARSFGLNTDASFRFERGIDVELVEFALKRAALLIQDIAGGEISMELIRIENNAPKSKTIEFNTLKSNQLLGINLTEDETETILSELDIQVENKNNSTWTLKSPAYRVDVTRACDISEEILRIYGFNKVEIPAKLNTSLPIFPKPNLEKIQNTIAELLVYKGFSEVLNNSLTKQSYDLLSESNPKDSVSILNPLSQDLNVMRKSLIFGILENIQHNQNRQQSNLRLFEYGTTYLKTETGFNEEKHLTLAITGKKEIERWNSDKELVDYFTLKGYVEAIFSKLGLTKFLTYSELTNSTFSDGQSILIQGKIVAELGWTSKKINKSFDLKQAVYFADLKWNTITELFKLNSIRYQEIPKTFEVRRDFSLLLNDRISFHEIKQVAQKAEKKLLKAVELF